MAVALCGATGCPLDDESPDAGSPADGGGVVVVASDGGAPDSSPDAAAGDGPADPLVDAPGPVDAGPGVLERPLVMAASGTRIKLWGYRAPDGFAMTAALWDTTRGAACRPQRAKDGKLRCLPILAASPGYTEPACQNLATSIFASNCEARDMALVSVVPTTTCSKLHSVFRVGAMLPAGTPFHGRSGTSCTTSPSTVTAHETLYALGEEVPPTSFPELVESTVDASARLAVRYLTTEDGAITSPGFFDKVEGLACELRATASGTFCLPRDAAVPSSGRFADAACGIPLAYGASAPCTPDKLAIEQSSTSCDAPPTVTVHRVTPATRSYQASGGVCTAGSASDGLYGIGETVPVASFAAAEVEASLPGTRLVHRRLGHGNVAVNTTVFDTELGTSCAPKTLADGKVHCVPDRLGNATSYFADPACTQRLGLRLCDTAYVSETNDSCPRVTRVWQVGAPFSGTPYVNLPNGCVPTKLPSSTASSHVLIGSEVSADTFVELTPSVL